MSRIASQMAMGHYHLSKSLEMKIDERMLLQKTNHLIVDFRIDIKSRLITALRLQIAEAIKASDMTKVKELMKELIDAHKLRDTIAVKVGRTFRG